MVRSRGLERASGLCLTKPFRVFTLRIHTAFCQENSSSSANAGRDASERSGDGVERPPGRRRPSNAGLPRPPRRAQPRHEDAPERRRAEAGAAAQEPRGWLRHVLLRSEHRPRRQEGRAGPTEAEPAAAAPQEAAAAPVGASEARTAAAAAAAAMAARWQQRWWREARLAAEHGGAGGAGR